ncbi:putative protein TPRXL [Synchiropus splendidus]|uniref:putative protein TPRXL n=1 Tax=Synchiropus splendidus TaxID=270530 RepID=UPI00237E4EA1|nr:putative protein TPRXL [Synchiropus splendidus]
MESNGRRIRISGSPNQTTDGNRSRLVLPTTPSRTISTVVPQNSPCSSVSSSSSSPTTPASSFSSSTPTQSPSNSPPFSSSVVSSSTNQSPGSYSWTSILVTNPSWSGGFRLILRRVPASTYLNNDTSASPACSSNT